MRSAVCSAMAVAIVLLGVASPAPANADTTCQGKDATIVDTDGGDVQGTEGSDVIYALGPDVRVVADDGDDLVCLERGQVFAGAGRDSVQVRGTDGAEGVTVWHGEDLDIAMAGGKDFVALYFTHGGSGVVDGGPGGGTLTVLSSSSTVVDLEDGALALDSESATYLLSGFHDVGATAARVRVEGDEHDNRLTVTRVACAMTIEGGRGHDELEITGNDDLPEYDCARDPRPRLLGQRGNDTLLGRGYDDVLIGGPGRDVAKGSFGVDKCRAEREKGCER